MSEVKPTIAALRAWLKTCPLIADEQEATGAAFRIAGLEEESTAFSIEDSPGDPIITEYISGWEMAKNYLFLSRREYSEVDAVNIQNSGFFEQLTEWVMRQNARHNLPDLSACGGGKTPTGIAVTNSGYIVTNSAGSCKMQLQMRLTYYMLLPESTFTPLLVICTFLSGRLSCPTISPEDASNERKFVAVLAASATAALLDFL